MMYTVIDCETELILGPFETLKEAHQCAMELPRWEILNEDNDIVDWGQRDGHLCD